MSSASQIQKNSTKTTDSDVNQQQLSNYGATNTALTPNQSGPPKPTTASRIEPKVWLANERTWLNWCRTGVLLGAFGVALVNSSSSKGARIMGLIYALIAVGTISYGWFLYQKRIGMIKARYSGHFDAILAPLIISTSLFVAILTNFIFRAVDDHRYKSPSSAPKSPWIAAPASTSRHS